MTQRATGAADAVYYPGDEVLFKEKDKSKWSGPAKVTNVVGNKIRMIFGGYERTVSSIDVAHFKEEKTIVQTNEADRKTTETQTENNVNNEGWQPKTNLPADWQLQNNKDLRPKLNDEIEFIVGGCQRAGRVTQVGKKKGKDQNRCWVQEKDTESNFDFVNEVEHWRRFPQNH